MSDEPEVTTQEQEVQPEPVVQEEAKVPISELQAERQARQMAEATAHQMRLAALAQYEADQRRQAAQPQAEIDPAVAKLLAPYMTPILQQNAQLRQQLQQTQQQVQNVGSMMKVESDYRWLEQNVPYLDDVRDDLAKKIESLPQQEQEAVLGSKELLKNWAEMLYAQKTGAVAKPNTSKARATTLTGSNPLPSSAPGTVDWTQLSDDEYWKREKAIQAERQRKGIR